MALATPLSPNEFQALDRKLESLAHDLREVAALLRSRYGASDEVASSAAVIQERFAALTNQMHRRAMAARIDSVLNDKSRIA